MTTATPAIDPLRPRPPGGMGRGATLALLVHIGLVAALAVAVRWRTSEPAGVSAELWAAVPQAAAPREEVAPPPPPPPKPAERQVEPPPRDAEIATEKARKEKLQKERAEREKAEREKVEKAEKEKAELERRKKEDEEKRLAKQREENLKRIQGLAGATGGPTATGSAQQSAGPSASYAGRVRAAVYPNITFLGSVPGNPEADVEVHLAPTGEIRSARIVKSSGHKNWDDAVLDALQKTRALPLDNGRVYTPMVLSFRPRES
jgi:colicin import membrane protein